jgi:hypothetical protein
MQKSIRMDNKRMFPYDLDTDDDANANTQEIPPKPSAIPMRRVPLDQGTVATVISGNEGDRQALIGTLELMECAAHGGMTVVQLIAWFDEYLVKPGYMRRPTRVFENGVGTVYLGDARHQRQSQEMTVRRVLEVARKEVCTVLTGLLENPPDDRFIKFNIVTGRIYTSQNDTNPVWCVRARSDDRLSSIMLSLLAADVMSNQRTYYQRLSVCSECGRISFRLDTTNRKRCPAHDPVAQKPLDEAV